MVSSSYLKESKEIELDVSKVAINNVTALIEKWEMFVTITGELPNVLIFNQHQRDWYMNTLIDFAKRCGWGMTKKVIRNPTFRSIPIRVR